MQKLMVSKEKLIVKMIQKEIYKIKLLQPVLMTYSTDELILLAVNGLRMDLESVNQVKMYEL